MRRFMKCVTACFLAFILVFPGIAPAISWLEGKAARAQILLEQPYMLEQAPLGDECTSGEWRYALRETDGYAVITGYDGDETCPTVPMQLDGADVVGLAPRALAGRQMQSIALHSNILTIAADAFGGETPEILAPNGSYALYYAQKHQLAWRTQQDYVLQPHVIDFSDALGGRISRRGDSHVLFAPLEGSRLEVGDIFWMFDARGVEYFYRVTALSWQDGSILASVERPAIAETIVELKLDNSVTLSEADFIPAEGVEVVSTQSRAGVDFGQEEKSVALELLAFEIKNGSFKYGLDVVFENSTIITYHAEVEQERLTAYSMSQEQSSVTSVTFKAKDGKKHDFLTEKTKNEYGTIEIELGNFRFGAGFFFVDIDVCAGISLSGEIEITLKDYTLQTANYNFDTQEWEFDDPISSSNSNRETLSITMEVEGKAYVKIEVFFGVFEIVNVFKLEIEGGVKVALSATIVASDGLNGLPTCANLDFGLYCQIKIAIGAWLEFDGNSGGITLGAKFEVISVEPFDLPFCSLHICFDSLEYFLHFEEDCPFADSYKVTFETRTGETFAPIYVKKGDCAVWPPFYVMNPSETAGTFVGWATSAKATEPNWVLDDPNYPVTRSMTLYAIWDNMREVTFDSRGGSAVEAQSVPVGGYITRPQSPTKADNNFKYWYTLDDNNEISIWHFESDPMPDSSLTLYAEWDNTERVVNGTQYSMTIGSGGSVDCWQDTEKYFSYSLLKVEDQYKGVNINGLKNAPTHVRIPKNLIVDVNPASDEVEWKELPVLSVSSSMFRGNTALVGVEFDFGGELSASSMFSGCTALEYADVSALPLSSIPSSMFSGCTSLKAAVFGRGIKSIDSSAFANCKSLDSVDLLSGIGSIGASAFSGCTGLTEVEFNEDLYSIGYDAFRNCVGLTALYLPDSLRTIGVGDRKGPFYNCTSLKEISVGGVATIGEYMLRINSPVLEKVVIRGTVTAIADKAFSSQYTDTESYGMCNDFHYTSSDAHLIIEEGVKTIGSRAFYNGDIFTQVSLPDSLTSIGEYAFYGCNRLEKLDMGDGAATIDRNAFESCTSLRSVVIGKNVRTIGLSAFQSCTSLGTCEIEEGVTSIGYSAFQGCTSLTSLYLPDTLKTIGVGDRKGPFYNCTNLKEISVGGVETIGEYMLRINSPVLEKVVIRGTVTAIADNAFSSQYTDTESYGSCNSFHYTSSDAHLIIEEGVKTIGSRAFYNGDIFTQISLPDSLTSIGEYAFYGCNRIKKLDMGNGPATIDRNAFESCTSLRSVVIGKNVRTIGSSAFQSCTSLGTCKIEEGVTSIGYSAFQGCASLTSLYLPDSLKTIGVAGRRGPFYNCTSLKEISVGGVETIGEYMLRINSPVLEKVVIRGTVTAIADKAFSSQYTDTESYGMCNDFHYTSSDAHLIIEEGVKTIGSRAFYNGDIFTQVSLPDSLTSIGEYAFYGCNRIKELDMGDGPATIDRNAFESCTSLRSVVIGKNVRTIGSSAFQSCASLGSCEIEEGVTSIGYSAFQGCTSLTSLYLPDSLKTIGVAGRKGPFYNCTSLKEISVGGVATIGEYMLRINSPVLEKVVIRGTVTAIADRAFSSQYTDTESFGQCNGFHHTTSNARLIIEEGVKKIGNYSFSHCRIFTEMSLPSSLTSVGNNAFQNCSRLTHLRMGSGTPTISSSAFSGCSALGVYLTEENETVAGFFAGRNILVFDAGDAGVSFILTLQANGGLFADGTSVMVSEQGWYADLTSLPIPVNGEKLFCGWYMDEKCTKPWILTEMPARDVTLYAGWDVDCWTLALDLRGGALQGGNSLWVRAGSRPVDALIPVQEGRSFTGWYTDRYCTRRFDGVMPQADLKLYAGWTQTAANAEYAFDDEGATLVRYYLVEHENPALYLPETVEGLPLRAIAAGAFRDQAVEELWLPSGLTVLEEGALDGMAHLKAVKVHPNHPAFVAQDGVLFTADGQTLVHYPAARGTRYRIPSGVTAIGSHAFAGANLTNITWNDALVQIGDEAFRDTKLSSLEWKEGIVSIGQSAFAATPLTSVRLPRSLQTLGEKAFAHCGELQAAAGFEALVSIGSRAFEGCHGMLMLFGPVGDCALSAYAAENHHLYNYYSLTLSGLSTRKVQAGTVPVLPSRLALGENVRFTGWYMDSACTQPWPADGVMPAGNLTLYPGQEAVYTYETLTAEDGSQSLRLTGCSATGEEITIPSSIGGVAVTELAAGCFDHEIRLLRIPSCVQVIEEGAFLLTETLQIECQAQSAAESYAAAHGIAMVSPCYDLLFETNGGAKLDAQQYEAGETVELPVPVRDGYAFAGWFEDAALSIPAGADGALVMPAVQLTLYASWNLEDEEAVNLTVTYEQNGQTMTITGPAEGAAEIVIPPAIHGLPVTAISPTAFRGQDTVISVVIPGSISAVPARAFLDCGALQSVVLQEGVTQMEASAFAGCTSLHSVILPEGIDSIGSEAFRDSALVQLTLPASLRLLDASALDGCRKLEQLECAMESAYFQTIDGVLYDRVDQALVKYPAARAGQTYTVPEGVCVIGAGAFAGASELASIELPQSLWEMGEGAFAGCVGLVQLPDLSSPQLYAIADHAFQGCYRLGSVEIPGNIGVVGSAAFAGCVNLTDALVPDSVSAIGRAAFGSQVRLTGSTGSAAHQYALENGLLFIDPTVSVLPQSISLSTEELLLHRGESAALTAELLPEGVTASRVTWYSSQPAVAIVNDGQVRALAAGSAVITAVSENGLSAECRITVDAAIPVDTVILSHDRITLCETKTAQLEAVVLPANATDPVLDWQSSDENVFTVDENGCLTAVHPGHAVLTVTASSGVSFQCEVHVKPRVSAIELQLPAVCQKGEAIPLQAVTQPADAFDSTLIWTVSGGGVIENGQLMIRQAGHYTLTATAADLGTLSVSRELECLPDSVFTLPAQLTTIGAEAFAGSTAEAIALPEGATSIGERAFANCTRLYKITIPASVNEIAADAFENANPVIITPANSYAEAFAMENGLDVRNP